MMQTQDLWQKFQKSLLAFIHKRVNHTDDAQDILQSVFERIHHHQDQLAWLDNPSAWVFQITRNQIIDYYRKKQDLETLPDDFQQPALPDADDTSRADLLEFLSNCMSNFMDDIPARDQELMIASMQGSSLKQIAGRQNAGYPAIKSRANRAREKLRRRFMECCKIHSLQHDRASIQKNCDC